MEILSKFDGDKSPCPSNVPAPLLHQNENKIKNHKKKLSIAKIAVEKKRH